LSNSSGSRFGESLWYRIVPHRSYVKGWKISPSHYLNQQLDNIWLDKVGV